MPNPATGYIGTLGDGVLLTPWPSFSSMDVSKSAWIGTGTPDAVRERDEEVLDLPGRAEPVTLTSGVLRLDKGVLSGALMTRHGLTAEQWRERLESLIANQKSYVRIWMVTPTLHYPNVELGDYERSLVQMGGKAWSVSVAFREKR
jgi:hypothetical protein